MFKFAFKNMAIKKAKIILIIISIVISACVGILAYNISEQVDSGFKSTAAYYDMIIGPSGSSTQLAMNTMFFTEKPLGTISYEYVENLQKDTRVNKVVPFTMGDSYNGAKIVGTSAEDMFSSSVSNNTDAMSVGLNSISGDTAYSSECVLLSSNVITHSLFLQTMIYENITPITAPTKVSSRFSQSTCEIICPFVAP